MISIKEAPTSLVGLILGTRLQTYCFYYYYYYYYYYYGESCIVKKDHISSLEVNTAVDGDLGGSFSEKPPQKNKYFFTAGLFNLSFGRSMINRQGCLMTHKNIVGTLLALLGALFIFSTTIIGCDGVIDSIPTRTPVTPSPTKRECNFNSTYLPRTPVVYSPLLLVILYNPVIPEGYTLEYKNGDRTTDPSEFIQLTLGSMLVCGDQSAVFELGDKSYEEARMFRYESDACDIPPDTSIYEIQPTITDLPTPLSLPGLPGIQAVNEYEESLTPHFATATEAAFNAICWEAEHATQAYSTEISYDATQTYKAEEITTVVATLSGDSTPEEAPSQVVYEGLDHATTLFNAQCSQYSRCVLLIISDMHDRYLGYQGMIERYGIDLQDVEVIAVMPQCTDVFQPSCIPTQTAWETEFETANVPIERIKWLNGDKLEESLINLLRGGR